MVDQRVETDPFEDAEFATLDTREVAEIRGVQPHASSGFLDELAEIADNNPDVMAPPPARLNPGAAPLPPSLANELQPEQSAPIAAEPVGGPDTYELPDGSIITIEHTAKGWQAVGDSGKGGPEKFFGKTQQELLVNVMAGKLNATKKIRTMNRERKRDQEWTAPAPNTPASVPAATTVITADDVFQIKTQLASDPTLAMDTWFQKKTGMTVDALMKLAREGQDAKMELHSEGVSRAFMAANPEYFPDEGNHNYFEILQYLSKYKLRESFYARDYAKTQDSLIRKGFWTVQNLQEAYDELLEDGLFITDDDSEPEVETPVPVRVTQPVPVQQPTNPRIAETKRRGRAALGIRQAEVANTQLPTNNEAPSDEELDNLPTEDIEKLMSGIRRQRAQSARR